MTKLEILRYAFSGAVSEYDRVRKAHFNGASTEGAVNKAKAHMEVVRGLMLEEEAKKNDLEVIKCPLCGKALMVMDPFDDTEENEWNYCCDECGLDITIFAK